MLDVIDLRAAIISARIWFNSEDFLDVYEYVTIDDHGTPTRVIYSYHLQVADLTVQRWDRDPKKTPDLYHHLNIPLPDGTTDHEPSDRVTLKNVVEECWGIIDHERQGEWPT